MAGGGATDGGNAENNSFDDPEWQILEVELIEVGCTLEGELQQIESLAVENNKKVPGISHSLSLPWAERTAGYSYLHETKL